ncbi:MAG TPA: rhodanese-like domain-containing protein [Polyangiaceae bacterium]
MLATWQGILAAALMVAIFAAMFHHHVVRLETARARIARGAVLLDVDTPGEFALHHPRSAVSIPLADLARRAHELRPPETEIVVFAHRWWRGAQAVHLLRGMGFWSLYNAAGVRTKEKLAKAMASAEERRQNEEQPKLA